MSQQKTKAREYFIGHIIECHQRELSIPSTFVSLSDYQSALDRIKELEELYKNTTPQRKHLLELKAKIADLEKESFGRIAQHNLILEDFKAREAKLVEAIINKLNLGCDCSSSIGELKTKGPDNFCILHSVLIELGVEVEK